MTTSISCCARPGAEGVAVIRPGPRSGRTEARRSRLPHFHIGLQVGPQARPDAPVVPGRLAAIDRVLLPVHGRPRAWRAPPCHPAQCFHKKTATRVLNLRVGRNRHPAKNGLEPMGHRETVLEEHAKGGIAKRMTAGSQGVQSASTLPRSRRQRRLAAGRMARLRDARPAQTSLYPAAPVGRASPQFHAVAQGLRAGRANRYGHSQPSSSYAFRLCRRGMTAARFRARAAGL